MEVGARFSWETGLGRRGERYLNRAGKKGRNTCVGMGPLAGILKLPAFASQVIEDILVRKILDSIAQEVAQVINSSDIIV